jgi:hypothetical protein
MPEAQPLALLRRNIDSEPEAIRRVLTDGALRKTILGVAANDEKKAIKAFASHNAENALKTKPKVCVCVCVCFFGPHCAVLVVTFAPSFSITHVMIVGYDCHAVVLVILHRMRATRSHVSQATELKACMRCWPAMRFNKHGAGLHHRL